MRPERLTEGSEDDLVGKTVADRYRVEALIGEGGMGKVYRARQTTLDKTVVLKVLRQSLLADERTVQRFHREAKAASRLNHPNSIGIIDFGQDRTGAMYIVMEYVNGRDLHEVLNREWPLSEARIIRIVSQLLAALGDAHGAGVIHRDLKPENIMLEQRRDEPDFVKVLDFGIAKISDGSGEGGPALTRTGFVCGTPEYMSPEQARGAPLDHRSDLYAVGVMLYQLVTGMLPFESDSAVGFATMHLTQAPVPPSKRRADIRVSPALERLILRALAKEPRDRPQTAHGFREELLSIDADRRARRSSPPPSAPLPPAPRLEAHKPPPLPARARARPIDPTEVVALRDAHTDAFPPPPQRRWPLSSSRAAMLALGGLVVVAGGGVLVRQLLRPDPAPRGGPPLRPVVAQEVKLYEREVPSQWRDDARARRLERDGDLAHARGQLDAAIDRYAEAFELDPNPALSLKLGELYHLTNDAESARGFFRRHLRDNRASRARAYIEHAFPEVGSPP